MNEASVLRGMDFSACGAELITALVAAQQAAHYVGKDARNQGRPYASAEAMIAEGKDAMGPHGLCIVTTPCAIDRVDLPAKAGEKDGPGQWVCATMTIAWALLHKSGQRLTGFAEIDVVEGRGTPADKASRAADTYALGFIYRDVLQLNRGVAPVEDDVDARPDHERETAPRQSKPSPRMSQQDGPPNDPKWPAAKAAFDEAWREYDVEHRQCTERPASFSEICDEMGRRYGFSKLPKYPSADLFERMTDYLRKATEGLESCTPRSVAARERRRGHEPPETT